MDAKIQVLHPHMTLCQVLIFTWGGKYFLKLEYPINKYPDIKFSQQNYLLMIILVIL